MSACWTRAKSILHGLSGRGPLQILHTLPLQILHIPLQILHIPLQILHPEPLPIRYLPEKIHILRIFPSATSSSSGMCPLTWWTTGLQCAKQRRQLTHRQRLKPSSARRPRPICRWPRWSGSAVKKVGEDLRQIGWRAMAMRDISTVVEEAQLLRDSETQRTSCEKTVSGQRERWATAFMRRMEALYGGLWTAKYADQDKEAARAKYERIKGDYGAVLDRLTGDQVKAGLDECLRQFPRPPCPAEFYQASRGASMTAGVNGAAYIIMPTTKLLTRKMSEDQVASGREAISSMRKALRYA